MKEERYIDEEIKIEQRSLEDGTSAEFIQGKGIVFERWSKPLLLQLKDGRFIKFIEKIEKRAIDGVDFTNTESMVDHKYLLGKRSKGTMDITVTETSVNYSVRVPNTTVGMDAKENIRIGNLEGSSFQFTLARGGDVWEKSEIPYKRTITKFAEIREMGPVSRPAYGDTSAALRSLEEYEKEHQSEPYEADYKRIEQKLRILNLKKTKK